MQPFVTIKGISDRSRLPRLGKIRLGVKVHNTKSQQEYPQETSYFVVPPEVAALYGPRPTELDVVLPVNKADVIFPQAYKYYGSSRGLKCIGDGQHALRLDDNTHTLTQRACPCEFLNNACRQRAHLMVILPKINWGGIYQIDVGSIHSIIDINSYLKFLIGLIGYFAMVPLKLIRAPRETTTNGKTRLHYTLHLRFSASEEELQHFKQQRDTILANTLAWEIQPPDDTNPALDAGATYHIEKTSVHDEMSSPQGSNLQEPAQSPEAIPTMPLASRQPEMPSNGTFRPMTERQRTAILKRAAIHNITHPQVLQIIQGYTKTQASELITQLDHNDSSALTTVGADPATAHDFPL